MNTIVFDEAGTFEALHACERFLTDRGFSFGSWQRGAPCGALYGDYSIAKWRNLNAIERAKLHASFSGDVREGPIVLTIHPSCPVEALALLKASPSQSSSEGK